MNFDDDPLADLSDGSNDSFFDDPKPGPKRASLTKTPEKKSINDLFNIGDTPAQSKETSSSRKTDDWLGLGNKSPLKSQKLSKKISFDDDDDILGNMGLAKRPQSRTSETREAQQEDVKPPGKKLDLLESILGPSKADDRVKKPTLDDILKESKVKASTLEAPKPEPPLFANDPAPAREGRRGRRPSGGLMDPLGLFSAPSDPKLTINKQQDEQLKVLKEKPREHHPTDVIKNAKSAPNLSTDQGLPDWLNGGGAGIKQAKSENALVASAETIPNKPQEPIPPQQTEEIKTEKVSQVSDIDESQTLNSILTQQKLAQTHIEYQNTSIALQQQESQLLMALQLKKYEENLSDMQLKQQDILMKQEQQFSALLERQFAKQHIMENNMRLQQDRINNHIQMLISQPPITKHSSTTVMEEASEEAKKSAHEELTETYENIISSLKQRQLEAIFLVEESYKKQINLLEQTLETVEKRLKVDVEKLSENFEEKIKNLVTQHGEEVEKYKQKILENQEQHVQEIKQIRENHSRIIDELKFEQSTLIENIKEAKKSETSFFSESNSYLKKLDSNIEILFSNSRSLQEIKESVEKDYGVLSKAREESLKAKESEVAMMKATLEQCRESAEKERAELLGLVRSLETKIAEQNQNAREERWAFQQAASTLAARSAALDRESEFNRASIERERSQLKTLKESLLAEQERIILQMTEEKLALSAERSRVETSNKLLVNYDSQRAKAEIDAAVQIAREAAEMTDREREMLHREKCEIEKLKRTLLDQERKLGRRESELDNLERNALQKIKDGEKAMFESKAIEAKYNERLKDLQSQLHNLSNREKKLAEDKISLSRERLALNTMIRQAKKCGLCAADSGDARKYESESDINLEIIDPYVARFDNMDNELLRLRLSAVEDERSTSLNLNIEEK